MATPQLSRVLQRPSPFPRKKALVVAAAVLAAGGGLAYFRTGQRRPHRDSSPALNGNGTNKSSGVIASAAKDQSQMNKRKQGGIKNVKFLAGILLNHIGKGGLNEFLALATISVLRTALSNRLAKVQGWLFRAAFLTRAPLFMKLITENLILCFLQSAFLSTTKFLTGALSLRFRKILTNRIHSDYFQNMTYYKMSHVDHRITSVEQRIASDVPRFSTEMSELVQENLSAIFDGLLYTWRLCSYASPKYAFGVLGYVIGAGVTIQALSPPFGRLMSTEQQLEGEYRQLHSRLRTHSESIAFYGGQDREASIITQRFRTLVRHLSKVLHTQWWFGMIQDFVLKYLGSTFGLVLIIEPFFSGSLRPDGSTLGRAQMLSLMRYHTSVIISLFQAMGTLASNTRKLGRLSGYADRIYELMSVSRELRIAGGSETIQNKDSGSYFIEAPYIEFEGVKVVTPTGNTLVEKLTLKVEPGSNLLITGPNGSGKSSLFRVLGGLWPLVEGRIAKPGMGSALSHEIFYVPQRPYTSVGTLRDQLIYPLTSAEETQPLTAEGMRELLRNVDLEYLLDRYPQSQEVIWGDELSLGEQQRLGMARLFYHRPLFAILDECTSAVTTDMEERFCAQVRAMGTSCVTISHRPALVAFHDTVLSLDGEGGWTVHYKLNSVTQPPVGLRDEDNMQNGELHSDRQSDALTVQKQFFTNIGQDGPGQDSTAGDSYVGAVLATSPPRDPFEVVPAISGLQIQPRNTPSRISSLFKILVPTLSDKQGGQLLAVALLVLGRTWISDRIADLNGTSVKHVLQQDKAAFVRLVGVSILQSAVSAFLAPSLRHMTATLALGWRLRLTTHLSNLYFKNYGFYKAMHLAKSGTNDADQRITQDIEKLSGDLSGLVTGMIKPFVDILWFTYRMKVLTGIRGVGFLYAYMFLGLGFLRAITPDFGALTSKEQQLDGSFRYIHSRLRTHAESIAFFGGGSREQAVTAGRFKALLSHSQDLLRKRWIFGIADDFITKQLPHNVTWGLSLMYALEHKGNRALTSVQGELAHDLRFLASVVSQSFLAFGDILELYRKFLELSGGITRVSELNELLIAAQNGTGAAQSKPNSLLLTGEGQSSEVNQDIVFEDVDIVTPGQKILARKLSMRVPAGKSLLVTGPNGSGKSSLFRVLGGLWPAASGHIAKPGQLVLGSDIGSQASTGFSRDIFYVPQRPYTALGTLRDQIIYPLTLGDAKLKAQFEYQQVGSKIGNVLATGSSDHSLEILDSRLRTILEDVRLVYLLDREGGWDATANWEDMLSLGEQQRLGMARLFFHHPKFGILDECTNATSVDVEEGLYKKAQALGISVVTISQRPALIPYHDMELRLIDGEGAWELRSIKYSK
ncbi:ABC transporter D family member 1 isoform X1 [Physcomitrium patens]|uniref:ABC transporter D family member 1 n=1 Tax=Physcomitrium patens TaxID=3218 RepID=A0A7I4ART7_PHYPA|nr:ABC transporter D family member 1-like isoform X1 [Physcomitrium patens]XP_024394441.1 ABC transporter D family member 1-like isoform X1 [Physcomitrium patens]XP_024394442.1 ABC transporter D family member 1-like isoform X1 [Physcomitrium patens]XP_024394443.1 ABC transporter D family member 1-like isoform X1 [Physcomitrium patens]XP_024394445.1 ABC transporter D family member 1-like isoform X1 [Physcomitrium patens]XP_024394446.1 ABC transporter D family member 1-like isoform X1 [Physcomit|eukprot:XP_024394440.1 ABC transporter D family member 1-like isoform X1 [Physcomitrella patens]